MGSRTYEMSLAGVLAMMLLPGWTGQARAVDFVHAERGVEIAGFAEDGGGDTHFNDAAADDAVRDPADLAVSGTADSAAGLFTIDVSATQATEFVVDSMGAFRIAGELDVASAITADERPADASDAHATSTSVSFLDLALASDVPIAYEVTGSHDLVGEAGAGLQAFGEIDEFWLGGGSRFAYQGEADPGEHSILASIGVGPFAMVPGDDFAHGTLSFEVTGSVLVPTPAAIGPGLVLLGSLLMRRPGRAE